MAVHFRNGGERNTVRFDLYGMGDYGRCFADRRRSYGMVLAQGHQRGRIVRQEAARDVSSLPTNAFGSRSLTWWGTLAFMSLEGMGFALAIASYLYLMVLAPKWP